MIIGVFDSGKGGRSVLEEIQKIMPRGPKYYYVADSAHCPYGDKSDEELYSIVRAIVEGLSGNYGAKIIVIACNTATTKCIDRLRRDYPELIFVGTEPAVKLAAETGAKNILVLATPGTIKSERMAALLKENQRPGQNITLLPCPGLADAIEHDENIDAKLDELLKGVKQPDVVVLGCTHYSLIKDKIQPYFPNAKLIDGNKGVAKRVYEQFLNLL